MGKPLTIGLNAGILRAPKTGIGQYVSALGQELLAMPELELRVFNGRHWQKALPCAPMPRYNAVSGWVKQWVPNAYGIKRALEQFRFNRRQPVLDLYHEPSLWPYHFAGPTVMTVHDLTHVHYPHTQPKARLAEIEKRIAPALSQATRILVDSKAIAHELCAYYRVDPARVVVAPLGCSAQFRPHQDDELKPVLHSLNLAPRGYVLCVGTLEPRKNIPYALTAYLALPEALKQRYPLVLVGAAGWHLEQLAQPLQKALASRHVQRLGYVDEARLVQLYAGAKALLFPSHYEGFGLPVVEAMASATPVLLGQRSALPEVAGEAGIYVDLEDAQSATQALQQLLEDSQHWHNKSVQGLKQAQQFSWQRCAKITVQTYREALLGI